MAKGSVMKKTYVTSDGEQVNHANGAVVACRFQYAHGAEIQVDLAKLDKAVMIAAAAHGIMQKVGDAGAGKTPEEAHERGLAVAELLVAGSWVKPKSPIGARMATAT